MSAKETALVTGGAGFIGSHVARELLDRGYKVIVLDDLSGGFKQNVPAGAVFVPGRITDQELLSKLFLDHRIDYVFHLAAYAAEGLSHFIKNYNYTNNVIGSVNLINESVKHNVKCFVFTSSIAVYGTNQVPLREDVLPVPEDSYGISKLAVEMELKISHDMFGLNYVIFRPHNVYGEHQNFADKYRNVIGIFMNNALQGKPLIIFGDGEQTRAFTYIANVAPILAESIETPNAWGQVFNIGADTPHTVNHLAKTVLAAMGQYVPLQYVPARNEVKHAYCDHTKLCRYFKCLPAVPLETGVRKMAEWVKQVGARQSAEFKNIEITKNLPSTWAPTASLAE